MAKKEIESLPDVFYRIEDFLWEHPKASAFIIGAASAVVVLSICFMLAVRLMA